MIRVYFFALATCLGGVLAQAQSARIDANVSQQLASAGAADVLVMFADYPDLSAAASLATKEEKGRYVVGALRQNFKRHAAFTAKLAARGVAHREYWVANAVFVPAADARLVHDLANEPNVERIASLNNWSLDLPEQPQPPTTEAFTLQSRSAAVTPEWGLRYMNVPDVWAIGVRGAGVVVGGQDTGYDWTHPALQTKYRGYISADSADHNYNWHDAVHAISPNNSEPNAACGYDVQEPCDDNGHGTHTMGTMVGETDTIQMGVAPEAEWIACRNMDRGDGTPQQYLECFQWFIAPTDLNGENPLPEKAPHVIANSWHCPLSEGCDSTTYPAFGLVVSALRAAGVVVVVSAGNAGRSGCNTVVPIPARVPGAIAVAAHDSLGNIANFSSRGTADDSLAGPDIAAPGVAVLSSIPGERYRVFSGTSMAGPHVAGVVALMISARPELAGQVDTIEALLLRSTIERLPPASDSCSAPGATSPNEVFGHGTANANIAVAAALAWGGLVSGTASAKTLDASVMPNPVGRGFTLELPPAAVGGTLSIVDATGRLVFQRRVSSERMDVYSADWPAGAYAYRVVSEAGSVSGLLVR